jgi:hypothetical protein
MVCLHFAGKELHRRAVVHDRLAAEQIERLDAVRAFVDRVQRLSR